jgi:hypothetical protein
MEATILCIFVAVFYTTVGLALIVLPRRFEADRSEDQALDDGTNVSARR